MPTTPGDNPVAAISADRPVTPTTLTELETQRQTAAEEAAGLSAAADLAIQNWRAQLADAGRLLVEMRTSWISAPVVTLLDRAAELGARISNDHQRLADDRATTGQSLSDLWKRIKTLKQRGDLSADEAEATAELAGILIQIAETPSAAELPQAKPLLESAAAAYAQSESLRQSAKAKTADLARLADEVGRRKSAVASMGFDSLYLAAWLQVHGPSPIETSLVLKRGEQAYVNLGATLARHGKKMEWVGGSQGFSFPIAHTGIRYRVGSYRGHPVQHDVLSQIDSGQLVLTNLRLAFMGKLKLVSIPLDKIANLETYTDGVTVFQENKENPNVFLVAQVNYLVFYLNYLLGRRP
jgi:hypothetical protein